MHLSLRFHLDIKDTSRSNQGHACVGPGQPPCKGKSSEVVVRSQEEESRLKKVEELEQAMAALDSLVFELSLFGLDDEDDGGTPSAAGTSSGTSGSSSATNVGSNKNNEVVEMNGDGTFTFIDEDRKIGSGAGVQFPSRAETTESRGNHVDMAAIAENLMGSPDSVYGGSLHRMRHDTSGPARAQGRCQQMCKCQLCNEVLINKSFTLQGCGHSFHPSCLVLHIGDRLMEGLSPTCPTCFEGLE
jgi:hypothetical protein